ncbi:hypothetical protein Igag_1487 [Ignisphaera aggregans DSM 17230]|uniref:Uncharacterized protein n=1 Tax=Ignisphaera aggregans (strain DSM 17230 / JCM 13409 / AQ1.S1) TaxID=583356 RepID=E0SQV9_IGNAA|nr:hypothetical protein Igag_1487 [Ignisphaera aggregans DSM 17230]
MQLDNKTRNLLMYTTLILIFLSIALAVLQRYIASIISILSALALLSFISEGEEK